MPRFRIPLTLLLLAVLALPSLAADDEPVVRGKTASEWATLLRESKEPKYRQGALIALELMGPFQSRRVLPAVSGALREDSSDLVRKKAANALSRMIEKVRKDRVKNDAVRLDAVREALVAALRTDKSNGVREAAAAALGRLEDEASAAISALSTALTRDKSTDVRAAAADSLRRIGRGARDAVPELQTALADKEAGELTRLQAALALGRIGPPDALASLKVMREVLVDPKAPTEVRKAVAEALGQIGKDAADAAPALAAVLAPSSELSLRQAAAATLDLFGPEAKEALPALRKALTDDDKFVRSLALHTLGQLGNELGQQRKDVVSGIRKCLNDSVLEVRLAAIQSLGALGSDGLGSEADPVLKDLTEASQDTQEAVRKAALGAIKKIKGS